MRPVFGLTALKWKNVDRVSKKPKRKPLGLKWSIKASEFINHMMENCSMKRIL